MSHQVIVGRNQTEVAEWFEEGRTFGRTGTSNLHIEEHTLWHFHTIEAFIDSQGSIVSNLNCWSRGNAKCPRVRDCCEVSLRMLMTAHGENYSTFDPSKFTVLDYDNDAQGLPSVIFTYRGKTYQQTMPWGYILNRLSKNERLTPRWHSRRGDYEPDTYEKYQQMRRASTIARKAAQTRKQTRLKEIMPLESLETMGFKIDAATRNWDPRWDEKTGTFYVGQDTRMRITDLHLDVTGITTHPFHENITDYPKLGTLIKLVAVQTWHDKDMAIATFLCGINTNGQPWAHKLPRLPYAYASIEACQRAFERRKGGKHP